MKKILYILLISINLITLVGCSKSTNKEDTVSESANIDEHNPDMVFRMNIPEHSDALMSPTISLDSINKTFIFTYDLLSSYLNYGVYKVKDDILTATTSDGKYIYKFHISDNSALIFIQEGSAEIEYTDVKTIKTIDDGAVFIIDNNQVLNMEE